MSSDRQGHCSWCLEDATHTRVKRRWVPLRRNTYGCGGCGHDTLGCRVPGCTAMARGGPAWDDELCLVHDRTIPTWDGAAEPSREGWCSWCCTHARHALVQGRLVPGRRNGYRCTRCARSTVPCRTCGAALARSHGSWDDEHCLVCDGSVSSWEEAVPPSREAWCSWCYRKAVHALEQGNRVRRDVHHCEACGGKTLPCRTCGEMTRGGPYWDDERCSACRGSVTSWEAAAATLHGARETGASVRAVLARASRPRSLAEAAGLLRPFLLLASMSWDDRNQVAVGLGIALVDDAGAGDAHAEAWTILNRNRRGIQARTHRSDESLLRAGPLRVARDNTWLEILWRVGRKALQMELGPSPGRLPFAQRVRRSNAPADRGIEELERGICEARMQRFWRSLSASEQEELRRLADLPGLGAATGKEAAGGQLGPRAARLVLEGAAQAAERAGFSLYIGTVRTTAKLNRVLGTKIPMARATQVVAGAVRAVNAALIAWLVVDVANIVAGSDYERVVPAIVAIHYRDLELRGEGIDVREFL